MSHGTLAEYHFHITQGAASDILTRETTKAVHRSQNITHITHGYIGPWR